MSFCWLGLRIDVLFLVGHPPEKLLDRRLDELALPKQGTKLDKWSWCESENRRRLTRNVRLDQRDVAEGNPDFRELTHLPSQAVV